MALHLVGETIDKTRSHYRAETGKLIQLMRGIYVDADDDIETTVLRHAVRIAKYLYPQAYLSATSAILLGPTPDGRLFLLAPLDCREIARRVSCDQDIASDGFLAIAMVEARDLRPAFLPLYAV